MKIGYARVSSHGQKLDVQLDRLKDCDKLFQEKVSACSTNGRIELKKALDFVREGDTFMVTRLDRLARSVIDLSEIVKILESKSVDLIVLDQRIDTTSIYGKLQFNILSALGEFERELIRERSAEGRANAKAKGVKFGAKPKLGNQNLLELREEFLTSGINKSELAKRYGISRSSVYRLVSSAGRHVDPG